jgi:hypothetical protein
VKPANLRGFLQILLNAVCWIMLDLDGCCYLDQWCSASADGQNFTTSSQELTQSRSGQIPACSCKKKPLKKKPFLKITPVIQNRRHYLNLGYINNTIDLV